MVEALRELPPRRWKDDHIEDLSSIIRDALNAVDLSNHSLDSLLRFLIRLLPFYPEWVSTQLSFIFRERGQLPSSFSSRGISPATSSIHFVVDALLPLI